MKMLSTEIFATHSSTLILVQKISIFSEALMAQWQTNELVRVLITPLPNSPPLPPQRQAALS